MLLVVACPRPAPAGPADAGRPRAVSVKLGGTIADITGDGPWPGGAKPLSMHEIKGPLELTVIFPSGRTYRVETRSAIVTLDAPTGTVRDLDIDFPIFPSWDAAVTELDRQLDALAVPAGPRAKWKLREKRVQHPAYPVEGCIIATGTNYPKDGGKAVLVLELGIATPKVWSVYAADWPATCP